MARDASRLSEILDGRERHRMPGMPLVFARVGILRMIVFSAVVLCLGSPALSGTRRTQVMRIDNGCSVPLVEHPVEITLTAGDVRVDGLSPDFDSVRFFDGMDAGTSIPFWKMEELSGVSATFWVRVPRLPVGTGIITYSCDSPGDGATYHATSLTARLRAADGVRLALKTDPADKATTHPTVVVAEGWMTRLSPDAPPTVNRVLVDTMFPQDPSPAATANDLENPAVWISSDNGETWDWPPGVTANPSWKYSNNWIVGKPPLGGNNSDPEAIFLRAGSLPSGGPPTDTLRVYHRTNTFGQEVLFADLTSTDGAWSGVQITGFNATSLIGPYRSFASPTVLQKADGSLRMWASNLDELNAVTMVMYTSDDGVNWSAVGTADMGLPASLWGPWHFDVIEEGGVYWMVGSFGAYQPGVVDMRDLYMLRSEDGLHFKLLLPTVLEPALSGWFLPGTYRPSMLYVPGEGLEVYVGCNDRNSSQVGDGGTGRWLDPGWAPDCPRPVPAISTVFWGSARDFTVSPDQWPHPWYPLTNSQNITTVLSTPDLMGFAAQSTAIQRAKMDSAFRRPRNHEYHARIKIDRDARVTSQGSASYGAWIETSNGGLPPKAGVQYRWGSNTVPVAGPVALGDLDAFHHLRSRRVGDLGRCWWDGVELSSQPFQIAGMELTDDLTWQVARSYSYTPVAMYVDWYFYRDAVEPEPVVTIGCDDHDSSTVDIHDPRLGCVYVSVHCSDPFADVDDDGDVDQMDFGIWQTCYGGFVATERPAICACLDRDRNGSVDVTGDFAVFARCALTSGPDVPAAKSCDDE